MKVTPYARHASTLTAIFKETGFKDLLRFFLIQDGILVDVGDRITRNHLRWLFLNQGIRQSEFHWVLDVGLVLQENEFFGTVILSDGV